MVSYWLKVMPFTVVLPRLMAVLSWKEMKMVFGLVFLLIQMEMMETQWEEVEKCDVGVGPGLVLSGVYEKKKKEWWLCYFLSFLKKRKAGARGRFVLRSLLLLSMDFTIIYKGWKKGMRCLSRFMTLNSNGKDPIVGQKWTSQATKARLHKLIKLLSLERCCDTYKDDHPTRIKMGWSTMSNHEKWLVCFVWWRNKALNIFKKQSFRQLFK